MCRIAVAQFWFGHTLYDEGKYSEAEPHLLAAYEIYSSQSIRGKEFQDACMGLAAVYDKLHQPDKAAKFKALMSANAASQQK